MAANEDESPLAGAIRHAAVGRRIVERQRERIAELKAAGRPTLDAEQTLSSATSKATLKTMWGFGSSKDREDPGRTRADHDQTIRQRLAER